MLKSKILFFIVALCLTNVSCNLDLIPENALTSTNSFNTEKELNATTSSIHFFINAYLEENPVLAEAGIIVDEINGGKEIANWNPYTVVKGNYDWKGLYDIIFEANLLLDNIHRTKNLSADRYNYHAGQAKFALGLAYFTLSQRYGDCVITENSTVVKEYSLSPILDVINEAIKHGEEAYKTLPLAEGLKDMNGSIIHSKQIASKGTCAALLAHIYAWKGSVIELYNLQDNAEEAYKKSITYATELIDGKVGNYTLCSSPEELCEYLSNPEKNNPETIFSLIYDKGRSINTVTPNSVARLFVSWPVNKTANLGDIVNTKYRLLKTTVHRLYPDEKDTRKKAFFYEFDTTHIVNEKDYAIIYKFRDAIHDPDEYAPSGLSFRSLNADYTYWRLSDIILLRAECYAKLNNDNAAIQDLNKIRMRAQATLYPSPYDKEGLQKAIFREREREFIGENDGRYFDIIRNNYIRSELNGKFKELTRKEILDGALFLPVPSNAYIGNDGRVVNTKIHQKNYWIPYL